MRKTILSGDGLSAYITKYVYNYYNNVHVYHIIELTYI